jgi:pyruvate dehydrogenase E2 component (dihydrolipoamide acetyltransferase)
MARELGIDIAQVTPAGKSARILEDDVRRYAETSRPAIAKAASGDVRRRRVIAERLTQSIQTIAHFSLSVEIRADQLVSLRESLKGPVQQQTGLKLTVTDLLLTALGLAVRESPATRTVWADGSSQGIETIDIGLAVAAESGLVAPLIRNGGARGLADIARWRERDDGEVPQRPSCLN